MCENHTTIRPKFKGGIDVDFKGGAITSDAGLLLYREFERYAPFAEIIAEQVDFRRNSRTHCDEKILRQLVYSHIAGYEDDVDADSLRSDPLFPIILDAEPASQPTISRFMNFYGMADVWAFQRGNMEFVQRAEAAAGYSPRSVTLDFDTTEIPTFGEQHGRRFNAYYGRSIRQAMLCFNGEGDCLKGALYNGTDATSVKAVEFCKAPVRRYLKRGIEVRVRGDRLFGSDRLYTWLEDKGAFYYIRIKAGRNEENARNICADSLYEDPGQPGVFYGEYRGCGHRWQRPRRVCVKISPVEGELFADVACVATNDESSSPRQVVEFYFDRGASENFIKEGKNGFFFKKLSHTKFPASTLRLQILILAYNFNNLVRRLMMPAALRSHHIQTLRVKLVKVGARVVRTAGRIIVHLSSAYPLKALFIKTYTRLLDFKPGFA